MYLFFCAELLAYGGRLVYNISIDEGGVGALDLRAALLQIVEVASEGIHLVDENGVTLIYNKAASEFDGLSPDEVIGRHLLDVFPSLTHDSSTLLRVLKTGVPEIARQQTFSNFKGKKITTINSTHPIMYEGKIIGAVSYTHLDVYKRQPIDKM